MSRRPARFTQAELLKATKVAEKRGLTVAIERGMIRLVPTPAEPEDLTELTEEQMLARELEDFRRGHGYS